MTGTLEAVSLHLSFFLLEKCPLKLKEETTSHQGRRQEQWKPVACLRQAYLTPGPGSALLKVLKYNYAFFNFLCFCMSVTLK